MSDSKPETTESPDSAADTSSAAINSSATDSSITNTSATNASSNATKSDEMKLDPVSEDENMKSKKRKNKSAKAPVIEAETPTEDLKPPTAGVKTLKEEVKIPTEVVKTSTEGSGKRERKKIERLEFTAADLTQKKMFEIPTGSGILLADCPTIDHNLQSVKGEDLKILHKLLFKTPGQISTIKKNIRRFNGFAFEKNSADYDKKIVLLQKQVLADLKRFCHVLDLEKGGTKEELCTRFVIAECRPTTDFPKQKDETHPPYSLVETW